MKRVLIVCGTLIAGLVALSCNPRFVKDPSMTAIAAGDYTLVQSACLAAPGQGLDVCRVVEGSEVSQSWTLVLPDSHKIESGELRVRYKDSVLTYPITGSPVTIAWKNIIGHDKWANDDDGIAQVTGTLRYAGNEYTDVLGLAFLVVLQQGYTPLPIDSGNHAFETNCKIQYSTAGRSAIECK